MSGFTDRLRPVARELLAAWSRLPMRECVPDRDSFDPLTVTGILPVISLIERIGPDEWRLRLIGTEIERRWGRPLTGRNYLDLVAPETAAATLAEFRTVVEHPCGSWSLRRLALASGRHAVAETLRLPLRASNGNLTLILGCSGEITRGLISEADRPQLIASFVEHEFFDIGAGVPQAAG